MDSLNAVPLSALSGHSRNLLSERLNARKVLSILSPDQITRHRDWRGVASYVQLTTELANSINEFPDKIGRVLEIWMNKNDDTANVGRLFNILQLLDRYDVCEDLLQLARENKFLQEENTGTTAELAVALYEKDDDKLITYDDKLFGVPQRYHAYVLFAKEDRSFVDELLSRTRNEGFKMCTEDELLPGHATLFEPVSKLIAERCTYIVLVYSPDFLRSPALAFYRNLAQADSINKKQSKIIPIMYRDCLLPSNLAYYHNLRFRDETPILTPYNFWDRLSSSLRIVKKVRPNSPSLIYSEMRIIEEMEMSNGFSQWNGFLALPDVPIHTPSPVDLPESNSPVEEALSDPVSFEIESISTTTSETSEDKKKKKGTLQKILNRIRPKKHKKTIEVAN